MNAINWSEVGTFIGIATVSSLAYYLVFVEIGARLRWDFGSMEARNKAEASKNGRVE